MVTGRVAHGFYVLSDEAMVEYTCDTVYEANDEHSLLWNDPHLAILWPDAKPLLSEKDQQAKSLAELEQANLLPPIALNLSVGSALKLDGLWINRT